MIKATVDLVILLNDQVKTYETWFKLIYFTLILINQFQGDAILSTLKIISSIILFDYQIAGIQIQLILGGFIATFNFISFFAILYGLMRQKIHKYLIIYLRYQRNLLIYICLQQVTLNANYFQILNFAITLIFCIISTLYDLELFQIKQSIMTRLIVIGFQFTIILLLNYSYNQILLIIFILYDSYQLALPLVYQQFIYQDYDLEQFYFIICFNRVFATLLILNNVVFGVYYLISLPIISKFGIIIFQAFIKNQFQQSIITINDPDLSQLLEKLTMIKLIDGFPEEQKKFLYLVLMTKHLRICEDTNCFCTDSFEQKNDQNQLYLVQISIIDQIIKKNINNLEFQSIIEELIFIISKFEMSFTKERLFQSLIRYSFVQQNQNDNNPWIILQLRPSNIRSQIYKSQVQKAIQDYLKQDKFNVGEFENFCNLIDSIGKTVVQLLMMKYQVLDLLFINYQNPQFYILDELATPLVKQSAQTRIMINQLISIYPNSQSVNMLTTTFYSTICNDFVALRNYKKSLELYSSQIYLEKYKFWNLISQNKSCFVISTFIKDQLIFTQHSSLFPQIFGESKDIKESKLIGKEVEEIIVGPIKQLHKEYVLKLIKYGKPTFLTSDFLQLLIKDATGYIKEINSVIRLKNNMDELQFIMVIIYENDEVTKLLMSQDQLLTNYSIGAIQSIKLEKALSKLLKQKMKTRLSKYDLAKNQLLLQSNCNMINLGLCISQLQNPDELVSGIILIPKTNLKKLQSQHQADHLSQLPFVKYFLEHPHKCYLFISTYKYRLIKYNDSQTYKVVQIYSSKELVGKDVKVLGLEIMLKEFMIQCSIQKEIYYSFYSSYKSQIENNIKSSEASSYQDSWADEQFLVEDSEIQLASIPVPNSARLFPETSQIRDLDRLLEDSNLKFFNQPQQSIPSFSQRLLQEQSIADEKYKQSTKELQYDSFDEEDQQIIKEERIRFELNLENYNENQLKEEIDWIKQKIKKRDVKKQRKLQKQHNPDYHQTEHDVQSSIMTENSSTNTTLVYHIVQNVLNTNPRDLQILYILYALLLVSISVLIITNVVLVSSSYRLLYIYSYDRIYPLNQIYYLEVLTLSIQKLTFINEANNTSDPLYLQNNQTKSAETLSFFIQHASEGFKNSTINVNFYQSQYHQFLDVLDNQIMIINQTDQDNNIIQSAYDKRYFIVDRLMNIILDLATKDPFNISINGKTESLIVYNFQAIMETFIQLITSTDQVVNNSIQDTEGLIQLFLGLGLGVSTIFMLLILNQTKRIYIWRAEIVSTYFLFSNLMQQLQEVDSTLKEIVKLDEFHHQTSNHMIKNVHRSKQDVQMLKQDQSQEDKKLKFKTLVSMLVLQTSLLFLFLAYIVPFSIYIQIESQNSVKLNSLISHLGRTKCDFPADFTLDFSQFIPMFNDTFYPNSYSENVLEIFDIFMPLLDSSFNYLVNQVPFESQFQGQDFKELINLFQGDICTQIQNPLYKETMGVIPDVEGCKLALEGQLKDGYTSFINYFLPKLNSWELQINLYDDSEFARQLIIFNEELNLLFEAYSYILPLIQYVQNNLIQLLDRLNQQVIYNAQIITSVSLVVIIISEVLIANALFTKINLTINNTKNLLLIFNKAFIMKNKHLMQILQKQITVE
ncbi:hypothetical protein pb186bvf_012211 [Paramecium bursaria]